VNERENNGQFKSFFDFINRVNIKDVNKLQLEGLVKSGVFDEFDKDRSKILNSIPKIIQQIKNINDDRESHQSNLFSDQVNDKEEFDFNPSSPWSVKELLSEEFKSIGFYLTNHPLNEFEDIFKQLNIDTYNHFYENDLNESLVAGTIMSLQEKKSAKGTPYAIIKFSDKKAEFELFLFAEILVANREKLKESESFVLTLQKDRITGDDTKKRINVKKILSLEEVISKPYSKVTIELNDNYNLDEINSFLSIKGDTKINLIVKNKKKQAYYSLEENRKFDLNQLKALKAKKYVEKITV
jgi:DNA polymerase-3 subunit alpha